MELSWCWYEQENLKSKQSILLYNKLYYGDCPAGLQVGPTS